MALYRINMKQKELEHSNTEQHKYIKKYPSKNRPGKYIYVYKDNNENSKFNKTKEKIQLFLKAKKITNDPELSKQLTNRTIEVLKANNLSVSDIDGYGYNNQTGQYYGVLKDGRKLDLHYYGSEGSFKFKTR